MTNVEKRELRQLCKEGFSFKEIRGIVVCCDATIRQYIKVFSKKKEKIGIIWVNDNLQTIRYMEGEVIWRQMNELVITHGFIGIPLINWIFGIIMCHIGIFICISICYTIIRVILYIKKLIITLALAMSYKKHVN